jgi:hypothetical protein
MPSGSIYWICMYITVSIYIYILTYFLAYMLTFYGILSGWHSLWDGHWDLALAVEVRQVRQCPLRSGARRGRGSGGSNSAKI